MSPVTVPLVIEAALLMRLGVGPFIPEFLTGTLTIAILLFEVEH